MHKTPPRKLKVIIRSFLLMFSLFVGTLLVCFGVSVVVSKNEALLLSPLSKLSISTIDQQIATVKNFCTKNHLSCQKITSPDTTTIQIDLDNGSQIFLSTKKDLSKQLSSLQSITQQLTIKGRTFRKLDFRFDTVVVSF